MIEFDPSNPDGDEHELTPPDDVPDPRHDPAFSEQHMPPLGDLRLDPDTMPGELHFPGEDATEEAPATDADPSAPWPDDAEFSQWLSAPELGGPDDDPTADVQLREGLAAPDESSDLLSPHALVDWALRQIDG